MAAPDMSDPQPSRRRFLLTSVAGAALPAAILGAGCSARGELHLDVALPPLSAASLPPSAVLPLTLRVNGSEHRV